jgi:dihydroflavonol-4-reductase
MPRTHALAVLVLTRAHMLCVCLPVTANARSKTLAERAAWECVKDTPLELTTINPCYVQGALTSARDCSSATMVRRLLIGDMPAVANLGISICDMADVVKAHVAAMTAPAAAGQRYIIHSASVTMPQLAQLLSAEFGPRGWPVPTRRAPRLLLACMALFDATVRAVLPNVDRSREYDHAKAERDLGFTHADWKDAVRATAESLIAFGNASVPGAK